MSGTNKFNINDEVYHKTPDSEKAIVLDVIYSKLMRKYTYVVSTGWGQEYECEEFELTDEKIF